MFKDFEQVNREVVHALFGCSYANGKYNPFALSLPYKGGNFSVTPLFYKRGAKDFTQTKDITYPSVILQPSAPELDTTRYFPEQPIYGEITDDDNDGVNDTIKWFPFPLPLIFTYEISACSKSDRQQNAINQYLNKFLAPEKNRDKAFRMNVGTPPVETFYGPDCVDADYVEYSFRLSADPARSDGVFETIYELQVFPYVYLQEPVAMKLLQDINIGLGFRAR